MLALTGYTHVAEITKSSGRFFAINMSTPEGVTLPATLWTDSEEGVLRKPEEGSVYYFSGYLSGPSSLELTCLVPVPESDEPAPPTIVTVTGAITGPRQVDNHVEVEFEVFVKDTKSTSSVTHKLELHGSRWESRKRILQPGTLIHATGTLDSLTSSSVDELWLVKPPRVTGGSSPSGSPRRERRPFPGCLRRGAPLADEGTEGTPEQAEVKVEGRPFKKVKGKI